MACIKDIVAFNQKAGLLEAGYDDFLESSFQIEEALEGFTNLNEFVTIVDADDSTPKEVARAIVEIAMGNHIDSRDRDTLSNVDRLDKACDAVVFAVGSMAKLGLSAQQVTKALNIVMKYNNQKLSMPKDEYGKLMKPADFTGPEPELQKLLDER